MTSPSQVRRARSAARKTVAVSAVLGVITGTVALAGGALEVDGATRWTAAVTFAVATMTFAFAVYAAAPVAVPGPASETEAGER